MQLECRRESVVKIANVNQNMFARGERFEDVTGNYFNISFSLMSVWFPVFAVLQSQMADLFHLFLGRSSIRGAVLQRQDLHCQRRIANKKEWCERQVMTDHQTRSKKHLQTHQQCKISRPIRDVKQKEGWEQSNGSSTRKGFARADDDLWDCAGIQSSIIRIRLAETQRQRLEAGTAVTFNRPLCCWWWQLLIPSCSTHFPVRMTARAWQKAPGSVLRFLGWAWSGQPRLRAQDSTLESAALRLGWGGAKDRSILAQQSGVSLQPACGPRVGWAFLKQLHSLASVVNHLLAGAPEDKGCIFLCGCKDKAKAGMQLWSLLRCQNYWQGCHKADMSSW